MKSWLVRVEKKYSPDTLYERLVEALSPEGAVESIERGPVKFLYSDPTHLEYVGSGNFYDVVELGRSPSLGSQNTFNLLSIKPRDREV